MPWLRATMTSRRACTLCRRPRRVGEVHASNIQITHTKGAADKGTLRTWPMHARCPHARITGNPKQDCANRRRWETLGAPNWRGSVIFGKRGGKVRSGVSCRDYLANLKVLAGVRVSGKDALQDDAEEAGGGAIPQKCPNVSLARPVAARP